MTFAKKAILVFSDTKLKGLLQLDRFHSDVIKSVPLYLKKSEGFGADEMTFMIETIFTAIFIEDFKSFCELKHLFKEIEREIQAYNLLVKMHLGEAVDKTKRNELIERRNTLSSIYPTQLSRLNGVLGLVGLNLLKWYEKNKDVMATLTQLAENGNAEAAYQLGRDDETERALKWIQKAASLGHPKAIYQLFSDSTNKAISLLTKAAQGNDPQAQWELAFYYRNNSQLEMAFDWTRKAANNGYGLAQYELALCYKKGIGTDQDDEEAFRMMLFAACNDQIPLEIQAKAMFEVACCYKDGIGTNTDYRLWEYWLRNILNGNMNIKEIEIQVHLQFVNYFDKLSGQSTDQNERNEFRKKSIHALKDAARKGSDEAQVGLAYALMVGYGCEINDTEAIFWYCEAAYQGNPEAQYQIGCLFDEGLLLEDRVVVITQNKRRARYFFERSARQGYHDAQNRLNQYQFEENIHQESDITDASLLKLWKENESFQKSACSLFRLFTSNDPLSIRIEKSYEEFCQFFKTYSPAKDETRLVDGVFSKREAHLIQWLLLIIHTNDKQLFSEIKEAIKNSERCFSNVTDWEKLLVLRSYLNIVKRYTDRIKEKKPLITENNSVESNNSTLTKAGIKEPRNDDQSDLLWSEGWLSHWNLEKVSQEMLRERKWDIRAVPAALTTDLIASDESQVDMMNVIAQWKGEKNHPPLLVISLNVGGHWVYVLCVDSSDKDGKPDCFILNPSIGYDSQLAKAEMVLKSVFGEQTPIQVHHLDVQHDSINCGIWMMVLLELTVAAYHSSDHNFSRKDFVDNLSLLKDKNISEERTKFKALFEKK